MSQEISTKEFQKLEDNMLHHMDSIAQQAETLAVRVETFKRVDYVDTARVLSHLQTRLEETLNQFQSLDAELKHLREIMQETTAASERGALQKAVDDAFIENLKSRYALPNFDCSI